MSKKLFVLFAILVSGFAIFAQSEMRDVVYLKNGGITKGIIIEQIPNQSLKIQTSDGSVFVYAMEEIEKMAKEKIERDETNITTTQNTTTAQNTNYVYLPSKKSPFGAGVLSFLLPGAGELYATNWEKGWGFIAWDFLGLPAVAIAGGFLAGYLDSLGLMYSLEIVEIGIIAIYSIVNISSIIHAARLAKKVNIQNGYLSFKIGDKAHLGVRPEFSYNNMMMPSGSLSPQFTSGIGFSLSF